MEGEELARAVARLESAVPSYVLEICRTLRDAGHRAVAVGGAVRDVLLGRSPGDWDVATSAHPPEVQRLFRRTVPTGIDHGTITVLTGHGHHTHVEVTTFRGEGTYSDARRPDQVQFGVSLEEDLARRDFVLNAIAYDPLARQVIDPYDGVADLTAGRLRAVGRAEERFREDGLRIMRAVRFAATLELDVDPETFAGIGPALPSLARVSSERVHDELKKLMGAPRPSRGLEIARRARVIETILPELASVDDQAWSQTWRRIDAAQGWQVRIAALLVPLGGKPAEEVLRRLKFSNDDRERIVAAVRLAGCVQTRWSEAELRRQLAAVGRKLAPDAVALWRAEAAAAEGAAASDAAALADGATAILGRGDALAVGELAIGGKDLITELGMKPGPAVGKVLATLLARVVEEPGDNQRATLLAAARALIER